MLSTPTTRQTTPGPSVVSSSSQQPPTPQQPPPQPAAQPPAPNSAPPQPPTTAQHPHLAGAPSVLQATPAANPVPQQPVASPPTPQPTPSPTPQPPVTPRSTSPTQPQTHNPTAQRQEAARTQPPTPTPARAAPTDKAVAAPAEAKAVPPEAAEDITTVAISHKSNKVVQTTTNHEKAVIPAATPLDNQPSKPLREYDQFDNLDKQFSQSLVSLVSLLYKVSHDLSLKDSIYKYILETSAKASPLSDNPQVEVAGKDYKHASEDPINRPITIPVAQAKYDFLRQVASIFESDPDEEAESHLREFRQVEDEQDDQTTKKQTPIDAHASNELEKAKTTISGLIYEIDGREAIPDSANKSLAKRTEWHKMAVNYINDQLLAKRINQDSLLGVSELASVKDACVDFFKARATLHEALMGLYDDRALNPNIPLDELERRVARRLASDKQGS